MVTRKTVLLLILGFTLGVVPAVLVIHRDVEPGAPPVDVTEETRETVTEETRETVTEEVMETPEEFGDRLTKEANTAVEALALQTRINDWLEIAEAGVLNEAALMIWLKSRDESIKDPGDLTLWLFSASAEDLTAAVDRFDID